MTTPVHKLQTHAHLQRRWAKTGRASAFGANTRSEWRMWRRATIRTLKTLIGHDTFVSAPLAPTVTERVDCGDFTRERVELQTEPGVIMPVYVLVPKTGPGPFPAVIAPHGHGGGGKAAVAGDRSRPDIAGAIDLYHYDYGAQFARAGFITLCPDARGFGERQEEAAKASILTASCQWLNNMALPLGQTVTGMWVWDLHRLVDYVESRPECRRGRIGCAGLSGGGLQTLWATALDARIRCAVVSGYMYGYKEALLDLHTNCSCNYVPHLYEQVDMGDIAALIAPRPLLIESGSRDPLNGSRGLANVRPQVRTARKAFSLLGAGDNITHHVFDGEHRWDGAATIPWLRRHLAT